MRNLDVVKFRQDLLRDIRMELGHLKTCQSSSIVVSLPAAGVILGLSLDVPDNLKHMMPYFSLFPLLVLLPFWLIFFDKARSISRLKSFARIQEKLLVADDYEQAVIGLESALEQRHAIMGKDPTSRWESLEKLREAIKGITNPKCVNVVDNTETGYNKLENVFYITYWLTIFTTFFLYSAICFTMSVYFWSYSCIQTYMTNPVFLAFIMTYCLIVFGLVTQLAKCDYFKCDPDAFQNLCFIFVIILGFGEIVLFFGFIGLGILIDVTELTNLSGFLIKHLKYLLVLIGAKSLFLFIYGLNLYVFNNLIRGRYTVNNYEYRWIHKILKIHLP